MKLRVSRKDLNFLSNMWHPRWDFPTFPRLHLIRSKARTQGSRKLGKGNVLFMRAPENGKERGQIIYIWAVSLFLQLLSHKISMFERNSLYVWNLHSKWFFLYWNFCFSSCEKLQLQGVGVGASFSIPWPHSLPFLLSVQPQNRTAASVGWAVWDNCSQARSQDGKILTPLVHAVWQKSQPRAASGVLLSLASPAQIKLDLWWHYREEFRDQTQWSRVGVYYVEFLMCLGGGIIERNISGKEESTRKSVGLASQVARVS